MAYLLDTDVLIRAKNDHYGFDFCPAFWDWLDNASVAGVVHSIDAVYDEILKGNDDLSQWAEEHRSVFRPITRMELPLIKRVNEWAMNSADYGEVAKAEFASGADSYLIGYACASHHTVVTHERTSQGRTKIKIPDAAEANGITCITPFEMLREEKVRFVLASFGS